MLFHRGVCPELKVVVAKRGQSVKGGRMAFLICVRAGYPWDFWIKMDVVEVRQIIGWERSHKRWRFTVT